MQSGIESQEKVVQARQEAERQRRQSDGVGLDSMLARAEAATTAQSALDGQLPAQAGPSKTRVLF